VTFTNNIGAEWNGGPLITPKDNGDMSPTTLRATSKQITSYFRNLDDYSLKVKEKAISDSFHGASPDKFPLACLALSNSCFIDAEGYLYACSQIRQRIGNVLKTSFKKLWRESPKLSEIREICLDDLK